METRGPNATELLCLSWLPATLINKPASKVIKNLNSFQIREQLFFSGLSTSNVSRLNVPEIKPLVVFKHVLFTKEQASMETSLFHYNSLEYFFKHSRATNSAISVRIWPKLELVQDFMHVFVTCKFKEDQINSNRENVETSIF